MPFKSKRQQRAFFAMESRGEIPRGTSKRWTRETPNLGSLPEKKKTAAYHMGIQLALEDAGITKTSAVNPAALEGLKRMWGGAYGGAKDFFTAKRVREALKNLGQASESGAPKLTEQGQYLLDLPGAVGKTPVQLGRQDVLHSLKPYGAVAGLGTLAAMTPGIMGTVFPHTED